MPLISSVGLCSCSSPKPWRSACRAIRLATQVRFTQHKNGLWASGVVRRRRLHLLPTLYNHLNPVTQTEAVELEARLANAFEAAGLQNVRGGH